MVQQDNETDTGMDVDVDDYDFVRSDEESGDDESGRGLKRGRPDRTVSPEHDEPELKYRRTSEPHPSSDNPGAINDGDRLTVPEWSSASTASSSLPPPSNHSQDPGDWLQLPRCSLGDDALNRFRVGSKLDPAQALQLLYGDDPANHPRGEFVLRLVPPLTDALATALKECGILMLGENRENATLILHRADVDRDRLATILLEQQGVEDVLRAAAAEHDGSGDSDSDSEAGFRPTSFLFACAWGDEALVSLLLSQGAQVNGTDRSNRTALMYAVSAGHANVVRLLVDRRGIDLALTDDSECDALSYAAKAGYREVCRLLLFAGAPRSTDKYGSALYVAAKHGHSAICKLLIRSGFDVDVVGGRGKTPLMVAAKAGHFECCQLLLESGASIHALDENGQNVLVHAAGSGNLALLDLLVESGALLDNAQAKNTPLAMASIKGHLPVIKRLVELKVDLNQRCKEQYTALMHACENGRSECVELLLALGADPDLMSDHQSFALTIAAEKGQTDIVSLLLKFNVRLDAANHPGYRALLKAAARHDLGIATLLLSAGVSPATPKAFEGIQLAPVLSYCCGPDLFGRRSRMMDLLLQNGAPLEETNQNGDDPLMIAVKMGYLELVLTLWSHGAVVGQRNAEGMNALDIAISEMDEAMALADTTEKYGECSELQVYTYVNSALCLMQLLEIMLVARQGSIIARADKKATHPITRDFIRIMCLDRVVEFDPAKQPPIPATETACSVSVGIVSENVLHYDVLLSMVADMMDFPADAKNFPDIEYRLSLCGLPSPAVILLAPFLRALPSMKTGLVGLDTSKDRTSLTKSLLAGMCAMLERHEFADGMAKSPYRRLYRIKSRMNLLLNPGVASFDPGELMLRKLVAKVSKLVDIGLKHEEALGANVFSNLYDLCVAATLTDSRAKIHEQKSAPPVGVISRTLQESGVYAVLADHIDAAWLAAWTSTKAEEAERQRRVAESTRSSAARSIYSEDHWPWSEIEEEANDPYSEWNTWLGENPGFNNRPSRAFREELAKRVDRPGQRILDLPGQPPEVAGMYADLVHRQLHMLVQFIDRPGLAVAGVMPASV